MSNPTHATIVVTVKLADDTDLIQLGDLVALSVEDLGAEIVPCNWAPDMDTVADATGVDFDNIVLIDLNPTGLEA